MLSLVLSSCRCPTLSGTPHSPGPAGWLGGRTSGKSGGWEDDFPQVSVQVKRAGRAERWVGRQLLRLLLGLKGAREESAVFNREAGKERRGGKGGEEG